MYSVFEGMPEGRYGEIWGDMGKHGEIEDVLRL